MNRCLAIISARGGSKRIPRKNIKSFLGMPIIKYSIDAALSAGCFDEVMVSTDDDEIADLAKSLGALVPFKRSVENSDDFATTSSVIFEVLYEYKIRGKEFDYCCCIYPTAPFLTGEKLNNAFNLLSNGDARTLIPVVKFDYPIQRSFKIDGELLKMNWPEYINTRSQDLPSAYHDSGQFYFLRVKPFMDDPLLFTEKTIAMEMQENEVQDIDTPEDWALAELKYSLLLANSRNTKIPNSIKPT